MAKLSVSTESPRILEVSAVDALGSIHTPVDTLKEQTLKLDNTSKKIRFLASQGYSTGAIEKKLKEYGVTTKNGDPIRYQHVRNILMMKLK